jgi:hypothetical protein
MRRAWWRRNLWGLLGIVVVLPLSAWLVFATGWFTYFDVRPTQPVNIAEGETAQFGGNTITLTSADVLDSEAAPAGTSIVSALVEMEPGPVDAEGNSTMCILALTGADGVGSADLGEWRALSTGDLDWRPADPESAAGCDSTRAEPYLIETAYLVPDAALDLDLAVRLELLSELPRYLSLSLDPR